MGLLSKLFGRAPKRTMTVACTRCNTTYRLGEDSTVTTMRRGLGLLKGAVGSGGMDYPDLVMRATSASSTPIPEQLRIAGDEVAQVFADMSNGIVRTWYCSGCGNSGSPYFYPTVQN